MYAPGDIVYVDPTKNIYHKDREFIFVDRDTRMANIKFYHDSEKRWLTISIHESCLLSFNQPKKEESKMLEEKIEELIVALNNNTEVLDKLHALKTKDVGSSRAASKPAPAEQAELELEEVEVEATAPARAAKKKTSKKKTASNKNKSNPPKSATTIEQVREVLSQIDKASAKAVLKSFDCAKLSELDEASYDEVIAEANEYLEEPTQDEDDDMLG